MSWYPKLHHLLNATITSSAVASSTTGHAAATRPTRPTTAFGEFLKLKETDSSLGTTGRRKNVILLIDIIPQLKKSDSKSSRKESTAQTPEAPTAAGSPAEIEAALAGKNPNKLFGVNPSNIDKYSRVVFPVCFVCFNLTYWVIYLKISDVQYEEPTILH